MGCCQTFLIYLFNYNVEKTITVIKINNASFIYPLQLVLLPVYIVSAAQAARRGKVATGRAPVTLRGRGGATGPVGPYMLTQLITWSSDKLDNALVVDSA